MESAAQIELRRLCGKGRGRAIARAVGINQETLRGLLSGSSPRHSTREKFRDRFKIPVEHWDLLARDKLTKRAPKPLRVAPSYAENEKARPAPLDALGTVQEEIVELRLERERMKNDPSATATDRAKVATALATATRMLAQLAGGKDITISQILRSRHWREVMQFVVDTLRPWPDALEALSAGLAAKSA